MRKVIKRRECRVMVLTSRWKEYSDYWFRISWSSEIIQVIQRTLNSFTKLLQISLTVLVVDFHKYWLLSSKHFPLNSVLNYFRKLVKDRQHARSTRKEQTNLQDISISVRFPTTCNATPFWFNPDCWRRLSANNLKQHFKRLTNAFKFHMKIAISKAENQLILRVYGCQRSKYDFILVVTEQSEKNLQAAGCMSCINYINLWLTLLEFYSQIDSLNSHILLGAAQFLLWLTA